MNSNPSFPSSPIVVTSLILSFRPRCPSRTRHLPRPSVPSPSLAPLCLCLRLLTCATPSPSSCHPSFLTTLSLSLPRCPSQAPSMSLSFLPVDLTVDTLSPDSGSSFPTVTESLFGQGTISSDVIGISFEPITTTSNNNGKPTFCGTNSTKVTGTIYHLGCKYSWSLSSKVLNGHAYVEWTAQVQQLSLPVITGASSSPFSMVLPPPSS